MNDQINNNTKPKNIKELFKMMLKIVEKIYDAVVPISVSERKNKNKAKMKDPEIITIYLLIQCFGKSINKGYNFFNSLPSFDDDIFKKKKFFTIIVLNTPN